MALDEDFDGIFSNNFGIAWKHVFFLEHGPSATLSVYILTKNTCLIVFLILAFSSKILFWYLQTILKKTWKNLTENLRTF